MVYIYIRFKMHNKIKSTKYVITGTSIRKDNFAKIKPACLMIKHVNTVRPANFTEVL